MAAQTALNLVNALSAAILNKLITEDSARRVFLHVLAMTGKQIDPNKEAKAIENDDEKKGKEEDITNNDLMTEINNALKSATMNQPIVTPPAPEMTNVG